MHPLDRRLQLVTGKGGVGKTRIANAIAARAERRGKRSIVVDIAHLDPRETFTSFVVSHVRIRALARVALDNRVLARLLDAAPGVPELLALAHVQALVDAYDVVVVDLDATGHALMFLELPRVLDGLVGAGPLRRTLGSVSDLLTDEDRTVLHLVTVPRELAVEETLELHEALTTRHRVPLGVLFVNRMPEAPLSREAEAELARAHDSGDVLLARRAVAEVGAARARVARLRAAVELEVLELGGAGTIDSSIDAAGSAR